MLDIIRDFQLIKKIRGLIHKFLLDVVDWLASRNACIKEKSLAIIRVDAIGDYILFRNFLYILKASPQYKNYTITLVGNEAWRSIAETFDSELVEDFIFLNRHKFYKNYYYRFKILRHLASAGFDVVINPMYSREYYLSESIVKVLVANVKIACEGDNSNISKNLKKRADSFYTKLLANKKEVLFEFYRNQEFFEQLLESECSIKFSIDKEKLPIIKQDLPDNFIILFLGASQDRRKWSPKNFAAIATYLKEKYRYNIVICGALSDDNEARQFRKYFKFDYTDLVGKISLLELLSVINSCQLIITNETCAAHFAVALNMAKIFVLYNGNHFGRFTPYPESLSHNYHLVCHSVIEKDKKHYQKISHDSSYVNQLDIDGITVSELMDRIDSNINNIR